MIPIAGTNLNCQCSPAWCSSTLLRFSPILTFLYSESTFLNCSTRAGLIVCCAFSYFWPEDHSLLVLLYITPIFRTFQIFNHTEVLGSVRSPRSVRRCGQLKKLSVKERSSLMLLLKSVFNKVAYLNRPQRSIQQPCMVIS